MSGFSLGIFRVLFVVGGIILLYIVGKPFVEKWQFKFSGEHKEGIVIGFRGRGASKSILTENIGKSNGKSRSRRPVYRFPIAQNSLDSITAFSSSTVLIPWFNYRIGEKVTVVHRKGRPNLSHIFSFGIVITDMLMIFISLLMIYIGFYKR